MTSNRLAGRDVHIHDANNPTVLLGGLSLAPCITNAGFLSMLEIVLIFKDDNYHLKNQDGVILARNDDPLLPGHYYVFGSFSVNDEPVLVRAYSKNTGSPRRKSFRDHVRARDGKCAMTGRRPLNSVWWQGLEAAHIFPIAYQNHWTAQNLVDCISVQRERSINSVQNGILLKSDLHQLFDAYLVSINPRDNHKIVLFVPNDEGIGGKCLDQTFLNKPDRPPDELLLWHFRQAVLANMRGDGEPLFEHDFPPGSDIMGEISEGPKAAERMEFELFSRLSSVSEATALDETIGEASAI